MLIVDGDIGDGDANIVIDDVDNDGVDKDC